MSIEGGGLETPPSAALDHRARWPGIVAAALGLLTVGGLIAGLALATSDRFEIATWTAWGTIGISGAAVLLGIVSVIARLGRGWGWVGIVLGVVANPLVLVHGLDFLGRLGS